MKYEYFYKIIQNCIRKEDFLLYNLITDYKRSNYEKIAIELSENLERYQGYSKLYFS